jgi:O-antigen/teichoic acid export membrane protein
VSERRRGEGRARRRWSLRGPEKSAEIAADPTLPRIEPPEQLPTDEVKARAVHGTATLGARSVLTFGVAVAGNLVLARLLVPEDFGLVALGSTIILIASFFSQAGIGAQLIGRAQPPERGELQAVLGFQLAVSVVVLVCFTAAAWPFGRAGLVPAVMLASLPLATLRLPAVLVLERQLSYRAIATADVIETVANFAWAVATVAAGMGVWGLASATPVRSLVGSLVLIRMGPLGFLRPAWSWQRVRPILRFGAQFQAFDAVGVVRDLGLNTGIAAVAGFVTLGLWNFAYRIMNVPLGFYVSLWRVGYPAMSRLREAGEDPRPVIERTIGTVSVAMSPLLVGIAVSAPDLLPAVVGERWSGGVSIVVWACAAMVVNAPVSIPCEGYLLAAGQVGKVLLAAALCAAVWLGVTLPLLLVAGAGAVGVGWFAMAIVEAVLLGWWVAQGTGARVIRSFARPLAVALAAGSLGLAAASWADGAVLMQVGAVAAAEVLLVFGLWLLAGDAVHRTLRLSRRALAFPRAT